MRFQGSASVPKFRYIPAAMIGYGPVGKWNIVKQPIFIGETHRLDLIYLGLY